MLVLALQFSRDEPAVPAKCAPSTLAGRRRLSAEELAGVEEAGAPSQRNSERRATRAPVVPSNASPEHVARGKETGSEVIRIAE
jgi:hypothetical protein